MEITPRPFRVIVTGSRDWQNASTVLDALRRLVRDLPYGERVVFIHGDCYAGVDRMVREWLESLPASYVCGSEVTEERYPADWGRYGRKAGPIRNQHMVDLGADLCIAFIRNNSRGASMTAAMAERAGIPVWYYREGEE